VLKLPVTIDLVWIVLHSATTKANYLNFKLARARISICLFKQAELDVMDNEFPVIAGGILNQLEKCYIFCTIHVCTRLT